jgi:hypothetical protein
MEEEKKPLQIDPSVIEEKKADAEVVEQASKSWKSLIALAILNMKWVLALVGVLGILLLGYGVFFSGWKTKWFEKTPVESPFKGK